MDTQFYLSQFQSAAGQCREKAPGLLYFAGPVLGAIAFKVYKPYWAGDPQNPLTSPSRIFFSIWVTGRSVQESKLLYNIHALKLRQFPRHKITSRDFAARFRTRLKPHQHDWPNLSLDYGPLTLMQGWIPLNPQTLQTDILHLTREFEKISPLIDETLLEYRVQ